MAERGATLQRATEQGYEPSDVSVRAVLWVAAALVAVVAVSAALLGGLLGLFEVSRVPRFRSARSSGSSSCRRRRGSRRFP